ncbi:hypothetical protein HYDPIDRAFT_77792 [Hydnomerulius pinastri MD-312]|nr:hypothetical protein HYDPIDRAFT_77792 [Hydnomerulius pinastri MD-312]
MPRLLPRLLKSLKESPLTDHRPKYIDISGDVPRVKRKSLYHPIPEDGVSFDPAGRTHSILLDQNPITNKGAFTRHKTLPPRVHVPLGEVVPRGVGHDAPRAMSAEEREWWSSPYLRMLSTPIRLCNVSKRYMPSDFLIRLAPLSLPVPRGSRSMQVLMPDGLEHPKYNRRKAHIAAYVTCWKDVVQNIEQRGDFHRIATNLVFSKHLPAQISWLLRLRILQELEVLSDALHRKRHLSPPHYPSRSNSDMDPPILRRLTRAEFASFRETGVLPYPDAVAVLVAPPVNRNSKTKIRPQPSLEPELPKSDEAPGLWSTAPSSRRRLPPLSTMHGVDVARDDIPLSTFLPDAQVPLYNALAMFPSAPHRAALHKALCKVLDRERHFRGGVRKASGDSKASHAFLLTSSAETVLRADTAPLAIALWRLRMWEGDAFAGGDDGDDGEGWEVGKRWRVEYAGRMR